MRVCFWRTYHIGAARRTSYPNTRFFFLIPGGPPFSLLAALGPEKSLALRQDENREGVLPFFFT